MPASKCALKAWRFHECIRASSWRGLRPVVTFNAHHRSFAASSTRHESKTKTKGREVVVDLNDIPQGMIPLEASAEQRERCEGYPTVIQQARNNMRKFRHCVVLTRVGSFYEMYCEQAEEYGALLGLKVASKKTNNGPVAMAGFPFFQLDRFLKTLVQDHGKHVAISEEIPNDGPQRLKSGGLLFDRQVLRVITPGTLIDEQFLNPYEHNYLLAICFKDNVDVGLSWLDLSSGDFFAQSTTAASLLSALARIGPREILLHKSLQDSDNAILKVILNDSGHLVTYWEPPEPHIPMGGLGKMFEDDIAVETLNTFTPEETTSADLLLQYVRTQIPRLRFRLQAPIRHRPSEYLTIDRNSLRGLEVLRTLRDGNYKGSLLQAVRRTSTESGARLLAYRLTSPSMSPSVINERLDLVDALLARSSLLEDVIILLRQSSDTLRLVQKFSFGRGHADDLLGLARTISITQKIAEVLASHNSSEGYSFRRLTEQFTWEGPARIAHRISQAIDEEGLSLRQRSQDSEAAEAAGMAREALENHDVEGEDLSGLQKKLNSRRFAKNGESIEEKITPEDIWIMRRSASPIIDQLHESLTTLQEEKLILAAAIKQRLTAASLTLKFSPGLGHICHVKGKDVKADLSLLDNARTVGSSKSTRSFYLPEWTRLGGRIEDAKVRIRAEERNIFASLREEVIDNLVPLRRNAAVLDDLDVACSFAQLASEYGLKRPLLNHSCEHNIIGGRHIMVDAGLTECGRHFTPNDCFLNEKERIWLITGPNMAGKSTFLRQIALISILAQTGSFIPAEYAEIGLVDQIFSRVGSADDLSQDQSTFMVEMLETAHILRHATKRSFVIMDEVGRGTTPEDGIAIGFAVLDHLQHISKCRALFATHFHTLADMTREFQALACYCTDVNEEMDGSFRFDHRLRQGVNRDSHALKVAKLANLPEEALKVAGEVLETLRRARDS